MPPASVDQENFDGTVRSGSWRDVPDQFASLSPCPQRNATLAAKENRRKLTDYFCNAGAVPWQDRALEVVRRKRTATV